MSHEPEIPETEPIEPEIPETELVPAEPLHDIAAGVARIEAAPTLAEKGRLLREMPPEARHRTLGVLPAPVVAALIEGDPEHNTALIANLPAEKYRQVINLGTPAQGRAWLERAVGSGTLAGHCSDGLTDHADPEIDTSTPSSPPGGQPILTGTSSGVHYWIKSNPGQSFTLSPTSEADVSGMASAGPPATNGIGSVSVSYTASVTPVTVVLSGPAADSNGNLILDSKGYAQILVGQSCEAALSSIPCPVSNWQWSVKGTTFQSWTVNYDSKSNRPVSTTRVDTYPLNIATPQWYWNDPKNATETVSCTATVTPPPGQGAAFTVTATKSVDVYLPGWNAVGTGGTMQVNTASPANTSHTNDYYLYAGPKPGTSDPGGMVFDAAVSAPPSTALGAGQVTLVQLVKIGASYTALNAAGATKTYNWSQNGVQGLDEAYDYGWTQGAPDYSTDDSPSIDLTVLGATSGHLNDQFEDYLMFFPPGSDQCVPLAHFVWSTNGNATLPGTKKWKDFGTGSAGAVSPSGVIKFTAYNTFPMWTQDIVASDGYWVQVQ